MHFNQMLATALVLLASFLSQYPHQVRASADQQIVREDIPCPADEVNPPNCGSNGKCVIKGRWSTKDNAVVDKFEAGRCICSNGYKGDTCQIPPPVKEDKGKLVMIIAATFTGVVILCLIIVSIYMGWAYRKSELNRKKQQQQQQQQGKNSADPKP